MAKATAGLEPEGRKVVKTLEMEVLVAEEGQQQQEVDTPQDLSPRARNILVSVSLFLVCAALYLWNADIAGEKAAVALIEKSADEIGDSEHNKYAVDNNQIHLIESNSTRETGFHEGILNASSVIDLHGELDVAIPVLNLTALKEELTELPPETSATTGGTQDAGQCPALCDSRNEARKTKFGGDLLDFSDLLKMAEKGHNKLLQHLRAGYGNYVKPVFYRENPGQNDTKYMGIAPATKDGPSQGRLKRKLQIKVLKMMESLKLSEKSVHGCNCLSKTGSPTQNAENFTTAIPDYYEKYVFANGGHSQSAGHGNIFSETYTAYLGKDLRMVWDAIGVEMIDRNMGMGAMRAGPDIITCSKEVFGVDVDMLAWNYAMTDNDPAHWVHYVARAAVSTGFPVHLTLDASRHPRALGPPFEAHGLSVYEMEMNHLPTMANIPDCQPDGIQLKHAEVDKIPPMLRNLRCNGRLEGKDVCFGNKWSCTERMQASGIKCKCPHVGKRSAWHMGFKMHALTAHYIALPVVEMLLEGITDLVAMEKDPETLLRELEAEEKKDYEAFLAMPIAESFNSTKGWAAKYEALGDELENWFKGPSICRISLLPAMSRYLGITTNTDKVGGSARCGEEEYEMGIPFDRREGIYTYTSNRTPPAGEFSIMAPNDFRHGCQDDCEDIIMPDYKDWFQGHWNETGSASITFPNAKEKKYYGYKKGKFKGILGLVPTLFPERGKGKGSQFDLTVDDFQKHVGLTVNGQPVTKYIVFDSMTILQGRDGIYWKPSANEDYVLEFKPIGKIDDDKVIDRHMRLQGFVLM